ncbi:hypothetical protein ABTN28_19245, partial [Acinetobacter baumannii]
RANFFLNNKWHHSLILHEAGVPPIHTPVSVLASFPAEVKERLYLVHTSQKSLPPDSGLKIAPEGVENTLLLDVSPQIYADAAELLKIL